MLCEGPLAIAGFMKMTVWGGGWGEGRGQREACKCNLQLPPQPLNGQEHKTKLTPSSSSRHSSSRHSSNRNSSSRHSSNQSVMR